MNFRKLSQIMEDNKNEMPQANNPVVNNPAAPKFASKPEVMSRSDNSSMMRRIEDKLGVDRATYKPLLVHLSKNNEALQLFDQLIAKMATMNASSASNLMKASHNLYTAR